MATIEPLILDFLEWLAVKPRPNREVMDAWRSSCPRLTVWEDSIDAGYVARTHAAEGGQSIRLTQAGSFSKRAGECRRRRPVSFRPTKAGSIYVEPPCHEH